jgi:hypothetical protein
MEIGYLASHRGGGDSSGDSSGDTSSDFSSGDSSSDSSSDSSKGSATSSNNSSPMDESSFGGDCFDAANWLLGDQFNEHESMEDDDDGDVALDALADIWRGLFQDDYQAVDDYTIKKFFIVV